MSKARKTLEDPNIGLGFYYNLPCSLNQRILRVCTQTRSHWPLTVTWTPALSGNPKGKGELKKSKRCWLGKKEDSYTKECEKNLGPPNPEYIHQLYSTDQGKIA